MKVRPIALTAVMLLMLASALIISCSSAPETPAESSQDSDKASENKTSKAPVGSDVDRYNPKRNSDCPRCDLRGVELSDGELSGADLSGANLTGAKLGGG